MYTLMRNIFVNNYRRTVREMNLIDDSYSINQQHLKMKMLIDSSLRMI